MKAIETFTLRESARAPSDLCKLCFRPDVRGNGTLTRYRSNFHTDAVRQAGTFLCDGDRFVHRCYVEKEITANCFFGLGEWTVEHYTFFPRHDFSVALQGISRHRFAFFGQPLEPRHPIVCDFLQFLRRKTFAQVGAA